MSKAYKLTPDLSQYNVKELQAIKESWILEAERDERDMLESKSNVERIQREIEERKDD